MASTRDTVVTVLAFVVLFLGGGVLGVTLAERFAPDSWIAAVAGLFALPMAFGIGLQMWYGLALLGLVPRIIGVLRGTAPPVPPSPRPRLPGSFVFLPLSVGFCTLAGIVVGLLSPGRSALFVTLVFVLVGTAHGTLAWRLARAGYLIPPDHV